MASTSETGHAKNLSNFEILITHYQAFGSKYQPAKQALSISNLQNLQQKAKTANTNLTHKKNALDLAKNQRQEIFAVIKPHSTRIIGALNASDASQKTIDDAKSINTKIQGKRAKSINQTQSEPPKKTISVSQQSFDSLLENFTNLVDLLMQEPLYKPNEDELRTHTLTRMISDLQTQNTAVIKAQAEYDNALLERNTTFYTEKKGMVDTALDSKEYVKSVFGATSPQYKQINKIAFRNISV